MKLMNNLSFESVIRSLEEQHKQSFNTLELAELKLCYNAHFPLDKFAKLRTHWRMKHTRLGLEVGVDLFQHAKDCSNNKRLEVIRLILASGYNLSAEYARQLTLPALIEIYKGARKGVDVSVYATPKFEWRQMREIREGLEAGIDASRYADPNLQWKQMSDIKRRLTNGESV